MSNTTSTTSSDSTITSIGLNSNSNDANNPLDLPSPVGYQLLNGKSQRTASIDHSHNIKVEDWKDLELENSWVYYENSYTEPRYHLDPSGYVHIYAAVKDGDTTPTTILAILPMGYRPAELVPVLGFNSAGGLITGIVNTDGEILIQDGWDTVLSFFSVIFEVDRNVFIQSRS